MRRRRDKDLFYLMRTFVMEKRANRKLRTARDVLNFLVQKKN